MILISVVIPFYSTISGLLINAVNSALFQSFENIEVIVVDDCSPVRAKDELQEITDSRLKIINHNKNSNGGVARNSGVMNASGEFVAFLDYDDIWYENKLIQQKSIYDAHVRNGSTDIVIYSRCKIIDGSRTMIRPLREIDESESVGNYLFCSREIIQTSGLFLKTKLAIMVPFDDLIRHQDYQFCLSLEKAGAKFIMLSTPSYEFIQIPKLNDYNFSQMWLEKYQSYLSPQAIKGFKGLVIIRSMIAHKKFIKSFYYACKNQLIKTYLWAVIVRSVKTILRLFVIKNPR